MRDQRSSQPAPANSPEPRNQSLPKKFRNNISRYKILQTLRSVNLDISHRQIVAFFNTNASTWDLTPYRSNQTCCTTLQLHASTYRLTCTPFTGPRGNTVLRQRNGAKCPFRMRAQLCCHTDRSTLSHCSSGADLQCRTGRTRRKCRCFHNCRVQMEWAGVSSSGPPLTYLFQPLYSSD